MEKLYNMLIVLFLHFLLYNLYLTEKNLLQPSFAYTRA
jgi:hypothetical protein